MIHNTLIDLSDSLKRTEFYYAKDKNPSNITIEYYDSLGRQKREPNFGVSGKLINDFIHTFNLDAKSQYTEHYYQNKLVMVVERWYDKNSNVVKHLNISQRESKNDIVFSHEYFIFNRY